MLYYITGYETVQALMIFGLAVWGCIFLVGRRLTKHEQHEETVTEMAYRENEAVRTEKLRLIDHSEGRKTK